MSKSQTSFGKRSSKLDASIPASSTIPLTYNTCPIGTYERVAKATKPPLSTKAGGRQVSDNSGEVAQVENGHLVPVLAHSL
jgi:hypothetical protein